jgi:uncharacterized membrane protein YraQ (UPF0718 family)
MAERRKISINFYLILIVSLFGGLLKEALNDGGLMNIKGIVSDAHSLGMIFGYAFGAMICGYILAIVINFIFNLFREQKQHFSYFWIWLFVIVYFVGSFGYTVQQAAKVTPELRQTFVKSCVDQAKAGEKYQKLSSDAQPQALQKINDFCQKSSDQYFQFYEKCMAEKPNIKACIKEAQYQTCMLIIKPDNEYCQQLSEQQSAN